MKFMVKNARLSYVHVFEASQISGQGDATYSVCLLIDKNSPEVPKIKAAIEAERATLKTKYPKLAGKDPKTWSNPLRDGDRGKRRCRIQGLLLYQRKAIKSPGRTNCNRRT